MTGAKRKIYLWMAKERREKKMPTPQAQMELDRIVNMLKSFGWSVTSSKFEGDRVQVTFEKTVKTEVKA